MLKSASVNPTVLPLKRYFILLLLVQYIRFLWRPSARSTYPVEPFSRKYRGDCQRGCIEIRLLYMLQRVRIVCVKYHAIKDVCNQYILKAIASHINTFMQQRAFKLHHPYTLKEKRRFFRKYRFYIKISTFHLSFFRYLLKNRLYSFVLSFRSVFSLIVFQLIVF